MFVDPVEYLNDSVWAALKPSPVHGVGVFAIRDIPKGKRITDYSVHNIRALELMEVTEEEFCRINPVIRSLILDRTTFNRGQEKLWFYSPNCDACLTSFMNHSDDPNSDGEIALRDIKEGEEITEDYRRLTVDGRDMHPYTAKHYTFLNKST